MTILLQDKCVELYHSRLAILDLGRQSDQPMRSSKWSLVFNGEIYNYRELKHRFGLDNSVNSDTLVILLLLERIGFEQTCKELKGMFSICAYSYDEKKLYLSRDRFGTKPLYYYCDQQQIVFSSDIISIRTAVDNPEVGKLTQRSALQFLAFGYITINKANVIGIEEISPGEIVSVDKFFQINRHARINSHLPADSSWTHEVQSSAISDVAVAALVSGGIDSALLISLLSETKETNRLSAYTIQNDTGTNRKDVRAAVDICAHAGLLDHKIVEHSSQKSDDVIDEWINSMVIPTEDGINIWLSAVSLKTNGFKVCLTGVGGDELAGGYKLFRSYYVNIFAYVVKEVISAITFRQMSGIRRKVTTVISALVSCSAQNYAHVLTLSRISPLFQWSKLFSDNAFSDFDKLLKETSLDMTRRNSNILFSLYCYCAPQLLRVTDYFGMYHGIEFRPTLLTESLFGKVLATKKPPYFKDRKKILTSRIRKDLLDATCKQKVGFTIDISDFVRRRMNDIKKFQSEIQDSVELSCIKSLDLDKLHGKRLTSVSAAYLMRLYILKRFHERGLILGLSRY